VESSRGQNKTETEATERKEKKRIYVTYGWHGGQFCTNFEGSFKFDEGPREKPFSLREKTSLPCGETLPCAVRTAKKSLPADAKKYARQRKIARQRITKRTAKKNRTAKNN
jgi:hypothetical protein